MPAALLLCFSIAGAEERAAFAQALGEGSSVFSALNTNTGKAAQGFFKAGAACVCKATLFSAVAAKEGLAVL